MFGIGGPELAVILVLALLFVGPKKLPQVARTVGAGLRDLKRAANMAQSELRDTVDELMREADLDDTLQQLRRDIEMEPEDRLRKPISSARQKALEHPSAPPEEIEVSDRNRLPDQSIEAGAGPEGAEGEDEAQDPALPPLFDADGRPRDYADLVADDEPATEVRVAPEAAPVQPAPLMQPVEGAVSWRPATTDDAGEP